MKFLTANPDRGATLPSAQEDHCQLLAWHPSLPGPSLQHPSLIAICSPVATKPFPLAGILMASDAYRSYPAAYALPLVGVLAVGEIFLMSRGGEAESGATAGVLEEQVVAMVLGRFGSGEVGGEGG